MEHIMQLNPTPFNMIKSGMKTIELRLYDEKRQKVKIGDNIRFYNTENSEQLTVIVKELFIYESFEELYNNLPLLKCGYTEQDIDSADSKDMEKYYSKEMQDKYGVVGIEIRVISK